MGKQVCAKHNEAYETECKWCEPDNEGASGPYTPVNPLVGRTASELQRLMNEAWVKKHAWEEIPIWTGEIKQAHPWKIKQAPVAVDAGELQRLMNEAWTKLPMLEKDAKAAAVLTPSMTVECYPGCPLCRENKKETT